MAMRKLFKIDETNYKPVKSKLNNLSSLQNKKIKKLKKMLVQLKYKNYIKVNFKVLNLMKYKI